MSAITFICMHMYQWIHAVHTTLLRFQHVQVTKHFFPLTKKSRRDTYNYSTTQPYTPLKIHEPNTQLLLRKQEQLFPSTRKRYLEYTQKKSVPYLFSVAMKEESVPLRLPRASLTHYGMLLEVHSCSWNAIAQCA